MKRIAAFFTSNWWVLLATNPLAALDLIDQRTGKPDHGKIFPAGLLVSAIIAQFKAVPFAVGSLVVLGSLAYGYGAWRTFLKSRVVTATQTDANINVHQTTTVVPIPRDVERGVQSTVDRDWDGRE